MKNNWQGVIAFAVLILAALFLVLFVLKGPQNETITSAEPDSPSGINLDWHAVNPPRPDLTCWAAEVKESTGYGGYGFSYLYCE